MGTVEERHIILLDGRVGTGPRVPFEPRGEVVPSVEALQTPEGFLEYLPNAAAVFGVRRALENEGEGRVGFAPRNDD